MARLAYTLLVALAGGFLGVKAKIPAGALLGAMTAVGFYNIMSGQGYIPSNLKFAAQVVVGGVIGLNFSMEAIRGLKTLILPALILSVGLVIFCSLLGFIIHKITGMDLMTALFSCAPGGLTNITLIAEAYQTHIPTVALLHTIRVVMVVSFLPFIFKFLSRFVN